MMIAATMRTFGGLVLTAILAVGLTACSGGVGPSYVLSDGSRALEGDPRLGQLGLIVDEQDRDVAVAVLLEDGWAISHDDEMYDECAALFEHRYMFVIDREHLQVFTG